MTDDQDIYKLFLREIELVMHQTDPKDNHHLADIMERKAFEMNIHPKLAVALVNYFWTGMVFGIDKAIAKISRSENV